MIQISNLTFSYPHSKSPALANLSLRINKGDFVLITGPSGSGKSTFLRCLNGLVPHFSGGTISGNIRIDGIDVVESSPRIISRKVGFVFQDPESQSVLDKVEDELAFVLENAGMETNDMHERVDEILNLFDLESLRARTLTTLSGGERQKAALAAAFVQKPALLVLDEPTSQLDWDSARDVMRSLTRLQEESGTTIIIVEQRLDRVFAYADRLIVIDSGRISEDISIVEAVSEQSATMARQHKACWNKDAKKVNRENGSAAAATVDQHRKNMAGSIEQNRQSNEHRKQDPILKIKDLFYGYGSEDILNGLDLDIRTGEAVAIIGRNGTGKSTLLKHIVGLIKPRQGEILVGGRSSRGRSVADICREVAYLPQMPDDLLFADSVEQELEVTLTNHGLDPRYYSEVIEHVLLSLEIAAFRNDYPRDLSVGQRQRVAMGSVIVTDPKLILLDEPTRGLDGALKARMVNFWSQWLQEGRSLLLVTHDLDLARKIANRILLLDRGQLTVQEPDGRISQMEWLIHP